MENRISIPKPCHENWNEMQAEQQGRHCLACSKTVVDFTNWETEDIFSYLTDKSSERVCGRFNTDQVVEAHENKSEQMIQHVLKARMPLLRKIAAVIIICFGLVQGGESYGQKVKGKVACPKPERTEQMQGEIAIQPIDTIKQNQPAYIDTLHPQPQIMGMIAPYKPVKVIKIADIRRKKIKR